MLFFSKIVSKIYLKKNCQSKKCVRLCVKNVYNLMPFCIKTRIFGWVKSDRSSPLLNGDYPAARQDYLSKVNAISLPLSWLKYMVNNILTFGRIAASAPCSIEMRY